MHDNTNPPSNAVLSGIFFGPGGSSGSTGTAAFVKTDATTSGSWKGVYGADGFNVINDTSSYPSYVTVTPTANALYTWVASSTDVRALQKASSMTDRIAACWYSGTFTTVPTANDRAGNFAAALGAQVNCGGGPCTDGLGSTVRAGQIYDPLAVGRDVYISVEPRHVVVLGA